VLGQGAVVLLISDGLDRDAGRAGAEIERLHKSCRRLIWLNPLLRYDGFEPISLGAKAMMPHVDDFRTVHNLESLGSWRRCWAARPAAGRKESSQWPRDGKERCREPRRPAGRGGALARRGRKVALATVVRPGAPRRARSAASSSSTTA
jgi:hypothetical protein